MLGAMRSMVKYDFGTKVIRAYNPDIACKVETWLRDGEEVEFEGYHWVGHNRGRLNKNAVRGSGGVGLLIKHTMCQSWSVEVVNVEIEDVMWVKFENHEVNEVFFIAVCYIPPAGSSRDVDTEERFLMLSEQIQKFGLEGRVLVCGDFNARCGDLEDLSEEMVHLKGSRKSVDSMKNSQGELLIECMQNSGMCFVNGRKGADEFTCISSKGCSVVDYCLVPTEELDGIDDFMVETMSRCEARLCKGEEGYRIPDHSVLSWKLLMAGAGVEDVAGGKGELSSGVTKQRYVVPEDYMVEESSLIERIIGAGSDRSWWEVTRRNLTRCMMNSVKV